MVHSQQSPRQQNLASSGLRARVILACRDMEKAKDAANDIINDTGSNTVIPCKLDLADTKSICEFADHIYNLEKTVSILINNAGIAMCPYSTTTDGFEMQFGVNHLGKNFYQNWILGPSINCSMASAGSLPSYTL
ncbi:UNVERIFIED_CONTAM: hypothetical protein FKN15_060649 [Acipenser sinensis]